ncbi:unnamed protein product, partial [Ectocarpus sp. 6 AP-2014]
MADVAVIVLGVMAQIRDFAKDIKENDRQACRLIERVKAIEPAVLAVKQGTNMSSSESLRQLLGTVEMIRNFLGGYARMSNFNRALKRKSNASEFTQFGIHINEGVQALSLDIAVDAWVKEDAADRLDDLENMVDIMERMERNRTENHAEILGVLKALRKDERSELTEWDEIDYDKDLDFKGSSRLGSGGFGEVCTAKWNGSNVAVKRLLAGDLHRNDVRTLRKEIRIHSNLRFDHVVQLYAASTIPPRLCLVVELASRGSLRENLYSTSEPLAHALQTAFLYDIARGMSFLHKKGILHRDLKSANVLMFANGRLKLCDFGLSKIKTESSSRSKRGAVGTAQWMSPEEMDESPASERTDLYSFGVVCFEVITRMEPFKGMNPTQVIKAVVLNERRPQIPKWASASPDVVPLMEQCWKQDPGHRPEGFGPVVQALASVVSRDGDPRNHSAVAVDATSSPGTQRSVGPSSDGVGTAPDTVSDGVEASPLVAKEEVGTTALPRDSGNIQAPSKDLLLANKALAASAGTSGECKQPTEMIDEEVATKGEDRLHQRPDHREMAKGMYSQAESFRKQGKYVEANSLYLEAIEIQQKTLGPDHPDLAETLNGRALVLKSQGKYAEADALYLRAIEIGEKTHGSSDHPDLATRLSNRADLLQAQGKYAEADSLSLRAIEIVENTLGPDHPDLAPCLSIRAILLKEQ